MDCLFTSNSTFNSYAEVESGIASGSVAFVHLRKAKVWSSQALSLYTFYKLEFLQSIVMPVLLHGGETWTAVLDRYRASLLLFLMNCLTCYELPDASVVCLTWIAHLMYTCCRCVACVPWPPSCKAEGSRGLVITLERSTEDCTKS